MAYTPVPYTTQATVKRILRTSNNKIRIGNEQNDQVSPADLDEYILDTSRFIDSMLQKILNVGQVPLLDNSLFPEIGFSAPRLTAFFVYRDVYQSYRIENTPSGPRGWFQDAQDFIKIFIDNIESGVYPTLSPATDGPNWETVQKFFQTQIGVSFVHDQQSNKTSIAPTLTDDNIAPFPDD